MNPFIDAIVLKFTNEDIDIDYQILKDSLKLIKFKLLLWLFINI